MKKKEIKIQHCISPTYAPSDGDHVDDGESNAKRTIHGPIQISPHASHVLTYLVNFTKLTPFIR